jgi:hypothetical protein
MLQYADARVTSVAERAFGPYAGITLRLTEQQNSQQYRENDLMKLN